MLIEFDPAAVRAFRRHALVCVPAEACGLLARTPRRDVIELVRFLPIRNIAGVRDRFVMDPVAVVRVESHWRAAGLRPGAVFHSHPDAEASPSAADIAGAALWPDLLQVIIPVRSGATPREVEHGGADRGAEVGACTTWQFEGGLVPISWRERGEQPA